MEICSLQADELQSIRGQPGIFGWTTVETEEKPKRVEVLFGELGENDGQPDLLVSASPALCSETLMCTQPLQKCIRTRGSLPCSASEHPFHSDNGTEKGTVEPEMIRMSLEVIAGQLDKGQQISEQGTELGIRSADNQEVVIPSEVTFGCETSMGKDEIPTRLRSKNNMAEPKKGEANQSLEENQRSPTNKDVTEYNMKSRPNPLELVCTLSTEDKINLEKELGDQRRECTSLDNVTLNSYAICKDTYQRLENLEETIRELEMAISEMGFHAPTEFMSTFPQTRYADTEKEERKVDAGDARCGCATLVNMAFDCQILMPQEASSNSPKSSPTSYIPSLLPKPQFLLSDSPQVQFF
uniref:Uncharacterized protein n=1 Tax=Sphaerodactylus townsendi TaxID=933632 RepID=A0ACB8EU10_9SAUR